MQAGIKAADVQRDFLKYAAQQIKRDLVKNHPQVLERFKVNAKDRRYQFLRLGSWHTKGSLRSPSPTATIFPH
jgi:hypothetical protein